MSELHFELIVSLLLPRSRNDVELILEPKAIEVSILAIVDVKVVVEEVLVEEAKVWLWIKSHK